MAEESKLPVRREASSLTESRPFESFRREIDRMFDDFFDSFQRAFRIPEIVDTDKIGAEFKNGVLKLTKDPKTNNKISMLLG